MPSFNDYYPLMLQAMEQMERSYDDFGGAPAQARTLVHRAIDAIEAYIDRPIAEKDALMAATALYFSTDMTIYKQLPDNINEYGDRAKSILEDTLLNPSKPYSASPDLMQIGLALSIPSKDFALEALKNTKAKLEEVAENPDLLKLAIQKMLEAIDKGQSDGALHFTGEQPRLEEKAKEVVDGIKTATDELVSFMNALLAHPPSANKKAAPRP